MFRNQATLTRFTKTNMFALGRFARVAILMVVCWMNVRLAGAADFLYVASYDTNSIIKYDVSLTDATTVANSKQVFANSNLSGPEGLALDIAGNIYAANLNSNTISKFDSSGNFLSSISTNLNSPTDVAIDSYGNIFAANYSSNASISKFNYSGGFDTSILGNLNMPHSIAKDASDNLLVANLGDNSISKFNLSGVFQFGITGNLNKPTVIRLDKGENIYVVNWGDHTISKFNPAGTFLSSITGVSGSSYGLAFDNLGNIYQSDFTNRSISKYDSSGVFQFSWNTGFRPDGLATANFVPEPSTCALGLIAAGALAWVGRRRKADRNRA